MELCNATPITSEAVRTYLATRRMCSAENLASRFNASIDTIWPTVNSLCNSGRVRIAQKTCGSSCSTCSTTCATNVLAPTAIIISLEKRRGSDDDREC